MATIIIKNSTGSGAVPPSLTQGELAINVVDGKLFYGSGSGNIVKEFTGSGVSISASYALTASYASNGGVTQLLAGPNITLSPTNGLGQVTVSSTAGGGGFNTATGSYGSFYDTTTQTNPVANVPRSMSFDSTDITNGVSISGSISPFNTYIKTENAGIYNIQFSAQVDKTDGGTDDVVIWLRKNGIDLTDTATTLTLPTNNSKVVAAWNWFVTSAAGDYYQIIWLSADTDLRLLAEPISGTHPGIPSVILTANRVDQFLSNTGSFSGSFTGVFTGSLFGTASWATNALTASFLNTLNQNLTFNGNLTLNGTASISTLVVNQTQYSSGSNQLGDAANDTQTLFGTVRIPTGSLTVSGSVIVSGSDATINGVRVGRGGGNQPSNTAVGDTALNNNTTGTANTAVGYLALGSSNTTGTSNSAFGYLALRFSTGGSNSAFGTTALYGMTAGSNNSAFGRDAGYYIADGTTALTAPNSSVFLGANTKALAQGSANEIVIGQNAIGLGSNSVVLGNDNITRTALKGSVSIGTTGSISSTLHVKGAGATSGTTALRVENTNASVSLVVLDNGFVGIGTSSAQYQLDLYGTYHQYQAQGGIARYDISSANANQNRGVWDFYTNAAVSPDFFGRFGFKFEGGTADSFKQFQLHVADSTTPKFVVDGSGRVGIGTIIPSASLHISGASSAALLRVNSPASSSILYVSGSGNVGIGTSTPTGSLHIVDAGTSSTIPLQINQYFRFRGDGVMRWGLGMAQGILNWDTGKATIGALSGNDLEIFAGGSTKMFVSSSGNVGIGTTTPGQILTVNGNAQFGLNSTSAGARLHTRGAGNTNASTSFRAENASQSPALRITDDLSARFDGKVSIGSGNFPTASLDIAGTTRISGSFNTAASGSILTVIGSGSTQPIFTVQGSQGELFSINDSLSGSLFSVNDISGLPILEVFSDSTTLIGDYQDPMLITTKKVTMTNSGSFVVYSLPTASYDTAFFDYSIKSGSNARAGQIMAIQSGSSVNFTETTTTDFGNTTAVSFTVIVSGSNMVLTGSASTGSWTIKSIIRGL
jgi:hypothetical protein